MLVGESIEHIKFFYRPLSPKDLNIMYFTFLDAFADYPVPFRLNKEQFVRKFVQKLKLDFHLSVGAFDYDTLAGFIFTTIGTYKGISTAYNGGTGVRPSYRGKGLTQKMYEFLKPLLIDSNIHQCVLEVLVDNTAAIKAYEKIGFERSARLICFKLNKSSRFLEWREEKPWRIKKTASPQWDQYTSFQDFDPAFLDTQNMIIKNSSTYEIYEAYDDSTLAGYAIYQPSFARLSQIGIDPRYRRKGIATDIINNILENSEFKEITVVNVDEDNILLVNFLLHFGFQKQLEQYEMTLSLK